MNTTATANPDEDLMSRDVPAMRTRSARAGEPCTRCGAVGTHYLTCPSLRLPPGYLITAGRPGRLCGGPDHPDWPLPPRR
jgi:hypothetical protein